MRRSTAGARIEVRPVLQSVRPGETDALLDACFQSEILPLLTPIALDRGHPLPTLREGTWGLLVRFRASRSPRYGVVLVHPALPATVEAPGAGRVALEHVIAGQVAALFEEIPIESFWTFRVVHADSLEYEENQHEVARFLAGALEKSHRRLQEALPCAA
jgi:polyphosphate kinase